MFAINLPSKVQKIIKTLENNGFEAFVVGGCVRDSLLKEKFSRFANLIPKDWDIATSAKPFEAMGVLKSAKFLVVPTGIKHGTISAIDGKKVYEVTTYRIDGEYEDYRKPKEIFFIQNLLQDLSRRDFTFNAMAYHSTLGLVDPYGGQGDLEEGLIAAVGDPHKRFQEDALRILRALRFASRFGFKISALTKEAIFSHQRLLDFISKERIREEFNGILCGEFAEDICKEYVQIISFIFKNIGVDFEKNISVFEVLNHCPNDFCIRMAALFCTIKKPKESLQDFLEEFKYDKKTRKTIIELFQYASLDFSTQENQIKKHLQLLGKEKFKMLLELKIAQAKAFALTDRIEKFYEISVKSQKILHNQEAFMLQDLSINGNDIKKLGIQEGKEIKIILEYALDGVVNKKVPNSRDALIVFIKNFIQSNIGS
ncbi:hypothetical protein BKH41_03180 [Helicobacter sp. 12S02232-10]|uniref:CCA tRNA nucleotidyltransferase n=1 Tax=Helicobacter sp. 12S02232-10 TaxID=1476197 RepID=UPI000BA5B404|nr:hypothetical protein [Helicobacter sp. 12S02232-10]PAF49105.1 hypothetical protein BKH41_03180 [Helicobacter sp. 12S02232-10]